MPRAVWLSFKTIAVQLRKLSCKESYDFACPQHDRGGDYDNKPVGEVKGNHVEHRTAKLNNQHLADKDTYGYGDKATASLEMERTAPRLESAGVEHVPELYHHKDGEEEALFIRRKPVVGS